MRLQGLVRLAVEGQGRVPGLGLRVSSFQGLEAQSRFQVGTWKKDARIL